MLNFEKHKDKILKLGIDDFAVDCDGNIRSCTSTYCTKCIFRLTLDDSAPGFTCGSKITKWLYEEVEL